MAIRGGELPRLAMANWDHGWLTRSQAGQRGRRQLGERMAELVERGYNAVRVDAFPHLVAPRADGVVLDRFEVQVDSAAVSLQPRRALLELATLASEHGVRLWLTSRFLADSQARRNFVRRPRDFVDVWLETLELLHREGLAGVVTAVDFCHEFASPASTAGAWRRMFGRGPRNPLARLGAWSREAEEQAEAYLLEVPRALRAVFGQIAFGVSAGVTTESHLRKLDTTELDFLDSHVWLEDNPAVGLLTGAPLGATGLRAARLLQSRATDLALRVRGVQWLQAMEEGLEERVEFARLRRLEPVIGAGYVRTRPVRQADWRRIRDVSEALVRTARSQGFRALVSAGQARPENAELWADVDWHRRINGMILGG